MTETALPSIGVRSRAAREQSGLTLRQIADATKLSTRTLQDLEADRVARLPGGIYRRAIVRNVAREIGLDAEAMLRDFLAVHPDDLPPLPPSTGTTTGCVNAQRPPSPPRRGVWRLLWSALGA